MSEYKPLKMLLFLLVSASLAFAQSSGTIKVSSPSSCIIIAQIASLSSPNAISAMVPICADSGDVSVNWPISSAGDGSSSSIAVYAKTSATEGGVSIGCVLSMSQMQAMYLLGRDLKWDDSTGTLYDNTAGGKVSDPTTYQPVTCGSSGALLPSGLVLPDPAKHKASDSVWMQSITLKEGATASGGVSTKTAETTSTHSSDTSVSVSSAKDTPTSSQQSSTGAVAVDKSSTTSTVETTSTSLETTKSDTMTSTHAVETSTASKEKTITDESITSTPTSTTIKTETSAQSTSQPTSSKDHTQEIDTNKKATPTDTSGTKTTTKQVNSVDTATNTNEATPTIDPSPTSSSEQPTIAKTTSHDDSTASSSTVTSTTSDPVFTVNGKTIGQFTGPGGAFVEQTGSASTSDTQSTAKTDKSSGGDIKTTQSQANQPKETESAVGARGTGTDQSETPSGVVAVQATASHNTLMTSAGSNEHKQDGKSEQAGKPEASPTETGQMNNSSVGSVATSVGPPESGRRGSDNQGAKPTKPSLEEAHVTTTSTNLADEHDTDKSVNLQSTVSSTTRSHDSHMTHTSGVVAVAIVADNRPSQSSLSLNVGAPSTTSGAGSESQTFACNDTLSSDKATITASADGLGDGRSYMQHNRKKPVSEGSEGGKTCARNRKMKARLARAMQVTL
ncbi:hypothetical protein L204_101963 [Cryptococcus depauperatus]|nr:hypothetical protein L204_05613 [Cryptococcus depauperatus CBS 7855]